MNGHDMNFYSHLIKENKTVIYIHRLTLKSAKVTHQFTE